MIAIPRTSILSCKTPIMAGSICFALLALFLPAEAMAAYTSGVDATAQVSPVGARNDSAKVNTTGAGNAGASDNTGQAVAAASKQSQHHADEQQRNKAAAAEEESNGLEYTDTQAQARADVANYKRELKNYADATNACGDSIALILSVAATTGTTEQRLENLAAMAQKAGMYTPGTFPGSPTSCSSGGVAPTFLVSPHCKVGQVGDMKLGNGGKITGFLDQKQTSPPAQCAQAMIFNALFEAASDVGDAPQATSENPENQQKLGAWSSRAVKKARIISEVAHHLARIDNQQGGMHTKACQEAKNQQQKTLTAAQKVSRGVGLSGNSEEEFENEPDSGELRTWEAKIWGAQKPSYAEYMGGFTGKAQPTAIQVNNIDDYPLPP